MKKTILPAFLLILAVILTGFTGCTPADGDTARPAAAVPETAVPAEAAETEIPSVNSIYRLSTLTRTDSGDMVSTGKPLDMGEAVVILNETETVNNKSYGKIRSEAGDEVWISSDYIVPNGMLGVVIADNATAYTKPAIDAASDWQITRTTVLTVYPDSDEKFYQVVGWDEVQNKAVAPTYIKKELVSVKESDVWAAILLFKAGKSTNDITRVELLRTALQEFPNSVFNGDLEEALFAADPSLADFSKADSSGEVPEAVPAEISEVPLDNTGFINDDKVFVRETPSTNGKILTQLNNGDAIVIDKRTDLLVKVGDMQDYWFHLSSHNGWVFGAFVTIQ